MTTVADRLASERKRSERQRELRAAKRAARLAELARRKEEGVRKKRGVRDRLYSEYRMTPTKREVLVLLAQYRYLRTTSLIALLPHRHPQGLRATLRLLFDEGLITQPREAFKGYNSLITPNIYMLTEKGETHLHSIGIKPELIARIYRKKTDAPIRNFGHAMMISDGLSSIQAGTLDTPVEFIPWTRIIHEHQSFKALKLPFSFTHNNEYVQDRLTSDGLFGLRFADGKVSYFMYEAEHFNPIEPTRDYRRPSTLKKVLGYRDISKTKIYSQIGITNMRVVFLFPTATRCKHAVEMAERVLKKPTNLFLFGVIPVQEDILKAPPPMPELLTAPLARAGMEPKPLYTPVDCKDLPQ